MSVTFLPEPVGSPSLAPPVHGGLVKVVQAGVWLRRIGAAIASGLYTAIMESRYRHAARQLQMLDDHMLRDIGITRGEINSVVRHGRSIDMNR